MKITIEGTKSELEFVKEYAGKFLLDGRTMSDRTVKMKIKTLMNASGQSDYKFKISKKECEEMASSGAMISLSYMLYNAAVDAEKMLGQEEWFNENIVNKKKAVR